MSKPSEADGELALEAGVDRDGLTVGGTQG
jgi:hypothetical protein